MYIERDRYVYIYIYLYLIIYFIYIYMFGGNPTTTHESRTTTGKLRIRVLHRCGRPGFYGLLQYVHASALVMSATSVTLSVTFESL